MGLPTIAVPEYTLTIPSTKKEIKYRPFLVKEEKILLLAMETEDQKQIINATKTIIKNCVFGDIDVDTLATFDIEYIFLQLRGKAKGEDIELKYKCPKCENDIAVTVNTDEVQVLFKDDHTDNIKLTEHLGVIMKYPNIDSQLKIAEHEGKDKPEIEALFDTIIDSIDCIYDTTKEKIGKFSPGMHIPIISAENFTIDKPDVSYLFAWNHKKEIFKKEKKFLSQGGTWISHVNI